MAPIYIKQESNDDDRVQVSDLNPSSSLHSTTSVQACSPKASGHRKKHKKTKKVKQTGALPSTQTLSIGMFIKQEQDDGSTELNSHHLDDNDDVHTDQQPLNAIVESVSYNDFTQENHDDDQNNDNVLDGNNQGDDDESATNTAQPPVIRLSERDEQLEYLKQQVANLELANQNLSTNLAELEANCVALETDNRSLIERFDELRESNNAIQQGNSNLISQLESAKFELELKQHEIIKWQAKLGSAQKGKSVVSAQLEESNCKLINILAEKVSLPTLIDTLNDQLDNSIKAKQPAKSKETQTESDQTHETETLKTKSVLTGSSKGIIHADQHFDKVSSGLVNDAMNSDTQQDCSGPEMREEEEKIEEFDGDIVNECERVEIEEYDSDATEIDEVNEAYDEEKIQPVKRHRSSHRSTISRRFPCQGMHINTVALQCPHCDKMFQPDKFDKHLKVKHSIEQFRCAVNNCAASFDSRARLGAHRKKAHRRIAKWHCGKCPSHFTSYRRLSRHSNKQHLMGKFDCSFAGCTFTADHKGKAFNHYELHHKIAQKCGHVDCPYETLSGSHMKRHRLTHFKGLKPFQCKWPNCRSKYSSVQRCSTISHILRVHLSRKPKFSSKDPSKYLK